MLRDFYPSLPDSLVTLLSGTLCCLFGQVLRCSARNIVCIRAPFEDRDLKVVTYQYVFDQ